MLVASNIWTVMWVADARAGAHVIVWVVHAEASHPVFNPQVWPPVSCPVCPAVAIADVPTRTFKIRLCKLQYFRGNYWYFCVFHEKIWTCTYPTSTVILLGTEHDQAFASHLDLNVTVVTVAAAGSAICIQGYVSYAEWNMPYQVLLCALSMAKAGPQ